MKQISIHIPYTQLPFMMELLQKFDFVKIDTPAIDKGFILTDAQKKRWKLNGQNVKKSGLFTGLGQCKKYFKGWLMAHKIKITPTAFNDLQNSIDYYNKQQ